MRTQHQTNSLHLKPGDTFMLVSQRQVLLCTVDAVRINSLAVPTSPAAAPAGSSTPAPPATPTKTTKIPELHAATIYIKERDNAS